MLSIIGIGGGGQNKESIPPATVYSAPPSTPVEPRL